MKCFGGGIKWKGVFVHVLDFLGLRRSRSSTLKHLPNKMALFWSHAGDAL